MQDQQKATDHAEGVEGIKRYVVKDTWKDYEVTLEVNHAILSPERAKLINDFWTNSEDRLLVASVGLPCFDELEIAEVKTCSSN